MNVLLMHFLRFLLAQTFKRFAQHHVIIHSDCLTNVKKKKSEITFTALNKIGKKDTQVHSKPGS